MVVGIREVLELDFYTYAIMTSQNTCFFLILFNLVCCMYVPSFITNGKREVLELDFYIYVIMTSQNTWGRAVGNDLRKAFMLIFWVDIVSLEVQFDLKDFQIAGKCILPRGNSSKVIFHFYRD